MTMLPRTYDQKERFTQLWSGRIERAYRSRKSHARRWEELQKFYRGEYNVAGLWQQDAVVSRIHFTITRQMAANLYYQDPAFNFVGRTMNGIKDALISQRIYQLERKIIGAEKQERMAIDYALKYGTGIIKHGWNTEYGTEPAWADKKNRGSYEGNGQSRGSTETSNEDLNLPTGPWTEHNSSVPTSRRLRRGISSWTRMRSHTRNPRTTFTGSGGAGLTRCVTNVGKRKRANSWRKKGPRDCPHSTAATSSPRNF
jgi:hypothetical protein